MSSSRRSCAFPLQRLCLPLLFLLLGIPSMAAAQNGTVTGTVTEEGTGLPIPGRLVSVVTINGSTVSSAATGADGAYSLSVPPGALYFVVTRAGATVHVPEAHPDVPCLTLLCSGTDLATATPISVAAGATVSGRDFVLALGGTITGTVTNATTGAPVSNVQVVAWGRMGTSIFSVFSATNASGGYAIRGLYPGTYFLGATNIPPLRSEIYDNIPCVGACSPATAVAEGTPIAVTGGATVSGRDFALEPGGSIFGTVTNAATGQPVQNVSVQAYSRVGTSVVFGGSGFTNAAGEYTISGLAAANWAVITSTTLLTNEIFGDILCPISCSTTTAVDSGAPVAVTLGATTSGVNFALDPGGSISGTVTNEAGQPLQNVQVVAAFRTTTTNQTRSAFTNATGVYTINALPTGTYALYTSTGSFTNEIFDNITCPVSCNATTALNTGTPVPVTSGASAANRNFALQPLTASTTGTLTGTLTDAASGLPIAGIGVEIYSVSGSTLSFVRSVTTGLDGTYSATGLVPGSYRAATLGMHPYRNEAFDNFPCLSNFCSITVISGGTPISITGGGTATASFGLSAGDGITGQVTSAAGTPLVGAQLNVYQVPSGAFAGSTVTNVTGRFLARGMPNGDYVIYTSNSPGYFNEIYNNIRCTTNCSTSTAVSTGTRITLTGAAASAEPSLAELVSGIDFSLDPRNDAPAAPSNLRVVTASGTATFTWNAPSLTTGGPPTSYLLEAGLAPSTTFVNLPIAGTGTSFSVPGVPPGTFYVRIRGVNAAGTGPASNEVILVVGAGGFAIPDPPTSVQAFMSGGLLTMTWTPPASGGPPSGYVIEAGSATGLANIATLNVPGPVFSVGAVPNGFYFLRVRSRNAAGVGAPSAEVMINVGNVPAPPGPPNFSSHSVSSGTVTLTWQAPTQGTATSYIIEAGSATGLANLAVVNTGTTALTQSFSGVPSGTYYVRVRAVNAQGASIVSNERTITVP